VSGVADLPSKSEINRCGEFLVERIYGVGIGALDQDGWDKYHHAIRVVTAFRTAHATPLVKVNTGLRSFVNTCGVQGAVTQRHKRVPRIIRKLHRMPRTSLARLEDIGGCRVVLAEPDDLEVLREHIEQRWSHQIKRRRDYIEQPKAMGYRAVHLVIERDERRIEIQLRTRGQQDWAEAVESIDSRLNLNLKDEDGPPELSEYFNIAATVIYLSEYGKPIASDLVTQFEAARQAVIRAGYYAH